MPISMKERSIDVVPASWSIDNDHQADGHSSKNIECFESSHSWFLFCLGEFNYFFTKKKQGKAIVLYPASYFNVQSFSTLVDFQIFLKMN